MTNYLSAYFIYEQLNIDINIHCNRFLKDIAYPVSEGIKSQKIIVTEILNNFDYRYDSFFASILKHDENSNIVVPDNINFISWNYDFQIEKAFMNFKNCSLNEAIEGLNMFATPQEIFEKPATSSHLIKLNGTAGFLKDGKFSELFDFSEHNLDNTSFSIYKDILLSRRNKIQNAIRFSWEGNPLRDKAINLAQQKITNSKIVVVIGYSFPYFNREIDRLLFARLPLQSDLKVYIQLPKDSIDSVIARFKGVAPNLKVEAFTETDQFLIPNELT